MLSVALPGWPLLCNFFEETNFCLLHAYLLACFYEVRLKFLRSHVYFHIGDCELCQPTIPIFKSRDDRTHMQFRNS